MENLTVCSVLCPPPALHAVLSPPWSLLSISFAETRSFLCLSARQRASRKREREKDHANGNCYTQAANYTEKGKIVT